MDGLDYATMDRCEIAAACLFGGSPRDVQECLSMHEKTMEHSPYSSPSPVALAARLLWIQHSGRHNHLEDAFGEHHIPTIETWHTFIKSRRESRSFSQLINEVIQHLETLFPGHHGVPYLNECLATPDLFKKTLETMDHPPDADAYDLDEIRASVISAVEDLRVLRQAACADLHPVAQATKRPLRD